MCGSRSPEMAACATIGYGTDIREARLIIETLR